MNEELVSLVERIVRLEEEKAATAEDIKEVYQEAKGKGFDPKLLKHVVKITRDDAAKEFAENTAIVEAMLTSIGVKAEADAN